MVNISSNGKQTKLNVRSNYVVIDALYLDELSRNFGLTDNKDFLQQIRTQVFPYTDTPFAEYCPSNEMFEIRNIKKVIYENLLLPDYSVLSIDSGIIFFINKAIFADFSVKFNYDKLVVGTPELIDFDYWETVTSGFDEHDIALVISPGINSGFEFEGSGTYRVV